MQQGDNLSEIAEAYGVGLSELRSWNGLRPGSSYIQVGQRLQILSSATPQPIRDPAPQGLGPAAPGLEA